MQGHSGTRQPECLSIALERILAQLRGCPKDNPKQTQHMKEKINALLTVLDEYQDGLSSGPYDSTEIYRQEWDATNRAVYALQELLFVLDKAEREIKDAKRIKEVIFDGEGCCKVIGINGVGESYELFSYYTDELSFTEKELVGLTAEEAMALKVRKDIEFIQSGV